MSVRKLIFVLGAGVLLSAWIMQAQDSPSLGDLARKTRQQKQQQDSQAAATPARGTSANNSQGPQPKAAHVYTNDEIPESTPDLNPAPRQPGIRENYKGGKLSAEQWKSVIRQLKSSMASIQRQIDSIQSTIRFAGGNYENHVAYNNRQREKEQQVENLKSQLSQQQKRLEDLQEAARRQGYSSVVYDP